MHGFEIEAFEDTAIINLMHAKVNDHSWVLHDVTFMKRNHIRAFLIITPANPTSKDASLQETVARYYLTFIFKCNLHCHIGLTALTWTLMRVRFPRRTISGTTGSDNNDNNPPTHTF